MQSKQKGASRLASANRWQTDTNGGELIKMQIELLLLLQ